MLCETETEAVGDGESTDQMEQSGVIVDEYVAVETQGNKGSAQNIATDIVPGQISTMTSHAVARETLETDEGDFSSVTKDTMIGIPSAEPAVKSSENIIDVDSQVQRGVMQVDVIDKDGAVVEDETNSEEKVQQKIKTAESEEEIGVEVGHDEGVYTQPDEEGIEAKPDESKDELGAEQIDSKEIEERKQEMEQEAKIPLESTPIFKPEDQIIARQHESKMSEELDIRAKNQGEDVDKVQPLGEDQSVVPAVNEPGQSLNKELTHTEENRISVEDMETEKVEENVSNVSIQIPENVEQSLQPSSELREELQSLEQPQPPSPPYEEPYQFHLPSQLPHEPSTHLTEGSKEPTPQRSPPQDEAYARDTPQIANPPEVQQPPPSEKIIRSSPPTIPPPLPRETIPPQVDPLAEAKAKARSVVEMREKRLNEESQVGTRGEDSGYDVDNYEQEEIPATESRQVMTVLKFSLINKNDRIF